jgi:hypothetical protein
MRCRVSRGKNIAETQFRDKSAPEAGLSPFSLPFQKGEFFSMNAITADKVHAVA